MKKTVRIKTPPPLSPDSPADTLIRRVSNEGHTGSPPPQSPAEGSETQDDPFNQRFAAEMLAQQSKEVIDNTRRNSENATMSPPSTAASVLNPFQRTLASMEPQDSDQHSKKKGSDASARDIETPTSNKPSAFDVDSFTKMMTTGAAPPRVMNKPKTVGHQEKAYQRSNDSKDEGVFSASTKPQPSAPDADFTSYADLSSATSDDDDDDDDESDGNMSYKERLSRSSASVKQPPPLPRHRHGKSVQNSEPRTASFTGFDEVSASQLPSEVNHVESVRGASFSSQSMDSSHVSGNPHQAVSNLVEKPKRTRAPPPIPTFRRSSSLRSKTGRDTDTSSISSNQPLSPGYGPSSPGAAKHTKVPPPPPSRRGGQKPNIAADQLSTSEMTSLASENASLTGDSISTDSSVLRVPAPGSVPGSRNSSGSAPTNSQMPPPPPPRRRRGSSKSSVEAPMSGEHSRSSLEASRRVSGLSQVSELGREAKSTNNILADLSAFQAEVDALRAESLRRAS